MVAKANSSSKVLLETFHGSSSTLNCAFIIISRWELARVLVHARSRLIVPSILFFRDLAVVRHAGVMLMASLLDELTLLLTLVQIIRVTCCRISHQS